MPLPTTTRQGWYWRVADPWWRDPADTSYSKAHGGRWNIAGEFGALYFNRDIAVAAANARWRYRNRAIKLFDLKPSERPILVPFEVALLQVADAISDRGVEATDLPKNYPSSDDHVACQAIGLQAVREGLDGVASRSAAEATATSWVGEELALFDTRPLPTPAGPALTFARWYSGAHP